MLVLIAVELESVTCVCHCIFFKEERSFFNIVSCRIDVRLYLSLSPSLSLFLTPFPLPLPTSVSVLFCLSICLSLLIVCNAVLLPPWTIEDRKALSRLKKDGKEDKGSNEKESKRDRETIKEAEGERENRKWMGDKMRERERKRRICSDGDEW